MAGLDPAIRVLSRNAAKAWIPGASPGMTGRDFNNKSTLAGL
jgi:hypothetical protein